MPHKWQFPLLMLAVCIIASPEMAGDHFIFILWLSCYFLMLSFPTWVQPSAMLGPQLSACEEMKFHWGNGLEQSPLDLTAQQNHLGTFTETLMLGSRSRKSEIMSGVQPGFGECYHLCE